MSTTAIAKFEAAYKALAEARTVGELAHIRNQAEAIRYAAKQAHMGIEMINDAAELKLRAERRAGELLRATEKAKGARGLLANAGPGRGHKGKTGGNTVLPPVSNAPTLADLGVKKWQSARWQRMAALPGSRFEKYIANLRDKKKELTTVGVLRLMKERDREAKRRKNGRLVALAESIRAVNGHFPTVVIDPPWDWGDECDQDQLGRARPTYATMTFEEIVALPVDDLLDENAHIYLWITNRSLPKGFDLFEAWGIRYITCLTWCKPSYGMGNYFRGSTEHVLFGVKGSLELLRQDVGTWFSDERPDDHSEKPDGFYTLVESCSPGPWLDMFARKTRPGWRTWGAEANGQQ